MCGFFIWDDQTVSFKLHIGALTVALLALPLCWQVELLRRSAITGPGNEIGSVWKKISKRGQFHCTGKPKFLGLIRVVFGTFIRFLECRKKKCVDKIKGIMFVKMSSQRTLIAFLYMTSWTRCWHEPRAPLSPTIRGESENKLPHCLPLKTDRTTRILSTLADPTQNI